MFFTPRLFSVIAFLFFSLFSFSQQNLRVHQLISGKKEIKIQCIAQDHRQAIWVGTEFGLVNYNGISYKLFTDKNGLPDNSVTALFENSDTTLWIGHANGKVSFYRKGAFSVFDLHDTASKARITSIICDSQKNIWIGTYGSGAYKYDGKNIVKYSTANGLGDDYVYALAEVSPGTIWLGTDAGITVINEKGKENFSRITTKNGLPDNIVQAISKDKTGKIWITMRDSGFCNYDLPENKIIHPGIKGGWKFGP